MATRLFGGICYQSSKLQGIPTLSEFLQQQQQPHPQTNGPKFFIETYGCQMNTNDSQIVASILQQKGYCQTNILKDANIVFINTCSIRANAENRVLQRMTELKQTNKILGVLGCMAERLKQQLFESGADIIVGPDGYKNLPNLLNQFQETHDNQIDTQLSLTETYDDVMPITPTGQTAYVSIMRGCNNMCSFCVVPFTRGRERSRNPESVLEEITNLTNRGIREVTLLGQNVNSYFYEDEAIESQHENSSGFKELYKLRQGNGVRFYQLLDMVAQQFPGLRIRFTSPHPKNFPDKVIEVISKHPNIAKNIHVPIQSGSDVILQKMRRNYTRDALIKLCDKIRQEIPNCTLSTDVIVGFCDESQEDFEQTMDLMKQLKFENAFMFAYSMREKTHAYRNYVDNVPEDVKQKRLNELIDLQHSIMLSQNKLQIGKQHLVLVEQHGKKENQLKGRSDTNHLVAFQDNENQFKLGDFVIVEIEQSGLKTLQGKAIKKSSIQ